ncbi:hypothetical protein FQ154_13420 [Paeniglutamicibacter gangotriensis]|uniref:Uncharacterized protein n=1 Tax=Paeniglutamicibacter gangotriensis TaxID=254787 RepID=A0A5B0E9S8_9MICC|nr:hypothetical protein [Paeniglutamicibacter gangotriensis]KAA0975794.1 hypothetical protein FQ154_13420 [Paeniglutamicibacter gangotriensis]
MSRPHRAARLLRGFDPDWEFTVNDVRVATGMVASAFRGVMGSQGTLGAGNALTGATTRTIGKQQAS